MQSSYNDGYEMEYLVWIRIIAEILASILLFGQCFKYRRITMICKRHIIPCSRSFTMSIICFVLALIFIFIIGMDIFQYNIYPTFLGVVLIFGGIIHSLKVYT